MREGVNLTKIYCKHFWKSQNLSHAITKFTGWGLQKKSKGRERERERERESERI
jgi:hypothetical protein